MWLFARKTLLVYRGRLLLAVVGVALAVLLELTLAGLYSGWKDHMETYLRHVRADLWVGRSGAYDLFHTLSLLPAAEKALFKEWAEVESVSSFVGRLMTCEVRGQRRHTFIVGVDGEANGPVALVEGRAPLGEGEIVLDQVFARKEGIHRGESLRVAGEDLEVVGIARGGNCFLYQYAFVTLGQAQRLFGLEGMVNYFLIRLSPEAQVHEVRARMEEALPFFSVFPKEEFIANNLAITGNNFLPILRVLEVIGLVVGTVVIGLTLYTLTLERSSEYGVLKAIGAPDRALYGASSLQALSCGLLGWVLGVPLHWGVTTLAQHLVPQFPAVFYWHHTLWMLGGACGMSLVAALLPAHRVSRIDPLLAFRA